MTIYTPKLQGSSTNCNFSTTDLPASGNNRLKQVLDLRIKNQLNKIIVGENNHPDYLAINIYWDTLRSLYKRKKHTAKASGLPLNYQELSEVHGAPRKIIRRKFVKLEELGLVNRSFQHSNTLRNQLIIYVWKNTSHLLAFFSSNKEEITELNPSTSHNYIAKKCYASSDHITLQNKLFLENGGNND